MKLLFTGIDQHAVPVDVALIGDWLVWLAAIVKRDWIRPYILFALAHLLPVVLPVHAMPIEIIVDAVFETGPDRGARIGGRSIYDDRARCGTAAVVDPVLSSTHALLVGARDVVSERTCIPDVDRAVELL